MINTEALIQALRCSATTGSECDHSCPYCVKETVDLTEFGKEGTADWYSCDCDRMATEAAALLEALVAGIHCEHNKLKKLLDILEDDRK